MRPKKGNTRDLHSSGQVKIPKIETGNEMNLARRNLQKYRPRSSKFRGKCIVYEWNGSGTIDFIDGGKEGKKVVERNKIIVKDGIL